MPQAVVAAAIPAAAGLGGAIISGRSAGKAAKVQDRAAQEALAFEREKEARRRQEYDRYQAEARAYNDAWQRQRAGLLQRWGVPMGAQQQRLSLGTINRQRPRLDGGSY